MRHIFSLLLCVIASVARAQTGSVTPFTNLAAYSAATANTTVIDFKGIVPSGITDEAFNPLVVSGVTFASTTPGEDVIVIAANSYSPYDYPNAFLACPGSPNNTETLKITLPSPTLALALDFGQLFGGGNGTITLSNGYSYNPADLPMIGNTAFVGFISSIPLTGLSYTVTGDCWVIEDFSLSTPTSTSNMSQVISPVISMSLDDNLIPVGQSATLTWSSTETSSCEASGNWNGSRQTSGALAIRPNTPGYYTFVLTCSDSINTSMSFVVLTVYGPTPSESDGIFHNASFTLPPPNQIVGLQTSLDVPPLPPAPSMTSAVLFVWPGLEPLADSVDFLPLDMGVLQPVLTWGSSCAPTAQPPAFTSWWISGEYVKYKYATEPGAERCYSGNSMLVNPGDRLLIEIARDPSTGDWTQTVTNAKTNQSVTFSRNMEGQGQNFLIFSIETYYGATVSAPITFSDTTIALQSPDWTGWCSGVLGQRNEYRVTPPISQNSGTECFVDKIVLTQSSLENSTDRRAAR